MRFPRTELTALHALLQRSQTLYAAEVDAEGLVTSANPALQAHAGPEIVGAPLAELLAAPQRPALAHALARAGDDWSGHTLAVLDARGGSAEDRVLWLRRDGDVVLVVAEPAGEQRDLLLAQVLGLNEELIATQRSLGRRQRELERAQAEAEAATRRANQLEAITLAGLTRPRTEDALVALLEIARTILSSDGATVLLVDEDQPGLVVRAAVGLAEEAPGEVRIPVGSGVAGGIARRAAPLVVGDIGAVERGSPSLGALGGSLAGVPLVLDGAVIGVLHVRSLRRDAFMESDLRLLELVGERAALAIGHAQLREREHRISETLQRSLLPERLPSVAGLAIAARYLPQAHAVHVGGDFYDAVALGEGAVSVAIGDVAGKGLRAAAVMGQLRSALRAHASDGRSPDEVLCRLDRLTVEARDFATAVHLVLDVPTGRTTFASAGHPPVLHLPAGAPATWLTGGRRPPLGTGAGSSGEAQLVLAPGDGLVLYTDGLCERRDVGIDARLATMRAAAEEAGPDPERVCDHLLARLAGSGYEDDVALLAVRRLPG